MKEGDCFTVALIKKNTRHDSPVCGELRSGVFGLCGSLSLVNIELVK